MNSLLIYSHETIDRRAAPTRMPQGACARLTNQRSRLAAGAPLRPAPTRSAAGAREVGVVSPRVAAPCPPCPGDTMERPRPGLVGSAFAVSPYGRPPPGYGSARPPLPPPAYGWMPARLSDTGGDEYERAVQRYSRAQADLALRQHWLHTFRQNRAVLALTDSAQRWQHGMTRHGRAPYSDVRRAGCCTLGSRQNVPP
ncbi:hypothetical protein FJT64_020979 [Amphibalanus amphitrite]|uniref:Uncharacterized protein n=1 Tax=Amphibalanus amphitrite TaxID=1232801 RepID=A0A6A4WVU3_AMPAM|nr:hypothetical protein FJT64_020979 [Amphibalanus amphitrite]